MDNGLISREELHEAPTIDAVEVVRCKDCWKRGDIVLCPMCDLLLDASADDGFCHEGVRRADKMDDLISRKALLGKMDKLKQCPFCGSKNVGAYDADSWGNRYVMCRTCRCRTEDKKSRALAVETWNRRANDADQEHKDHLKRQDANWG